MDIIKVYKRRGFMDKVVRDSMQLLDFYLHQYQQQGNQIMSKKFRYIFFLLIHIMDSGLAWPDGFIEKLCFSVSMGTPFPTLTHPIAISIAGVSFLCDFRSIVHDYKNHFTQDAMEKIRQLVGNEETPPKVHEGAQYILDVGREHSRSKSVQSM